MNKALLPVLLLFGLLAHAQTGIPNQNKLSFSLRGLLLPGENDSLQVSITLHKYQQQRFSHERFFSRNNFETVVRKIIVKDLDSLVSDDAVIFINEFYKPKEELTTGSSDLTLNCVTYSWKQFPDVNGDSLNVIVKERLPDTADIDMKGRFFRTGWEATSSTPHASLMSTIIAGGANSSPFARGCAIQSNVGSSDFTNLFPEPDTLFLNKKISIQNHSYGTVVENFYGNEAVAYDAQVNSIPGLVHVFSAGNSGNVTPANGSYANIPGVANLTGNFKQAKNIITVGSLDSAGQILPLSSKGPAYDGRVKPELMAYGEDGSSGAAATVSGAVLLVQHAYKKMKGQLPSASLVKSVLINSATDVGNANVDYASGYGNLNAYKALTTITENRIIESSVVNNELKTFNLVIPAGVSQLKLTLVWSDLATLPGSNKALVNDLDVQLKHPASSSAWLPWVLNASPNSSTLQSPAQRKIDTLNTVEQITVDNPVPGNYIIELKGSKVFSTSQAFAIAYQMDVQNNFYWTYPTATDPLIAKNTHWLRWETNITGPGQIEYATSGTNWRPVGNVVDLSSKYFRWTLPDTITTAVLRMKIQQNNSTIVSDSFTISPQPNLQTGFNCPDSFLLYWRSFGVNQFRVYELGNKYLQAFSNQADTSIVLLKTQHPSIHYAVAPVINGKEGIKSNTVNYTAQGVECYVRAFYLQTQTATSAFLHAEIGTLYNVQEVGLEKLTISGFKNLVTIVSPSSPQFLFEDSSLTQGENKYRFRVKIKNGLVLFSNVEIVYQLPASPAVLYPNPVQQNQMLNILVKESGRYSLLLYDDNGRLLIKQELNSTVTQFNAGRFGKGIYMARITDKQGEAFTEKILVY